MTKNRIIFPMDNALFKLLYLAMMDITKKLTKKSGDWSQTLDQMCIYFGERISPADLI